MVTIRYDDGTDDGAEITPMDFEYVTEGGYWLVVVAQEGDEETVRWIPRNRVYEMEGKRGRIRDRLQE
jgi:hypothetical protein